jgi:hypothetical protein
MEAFLFKNSQVFFKLWVYLNDYIPIESYVSSIVSRCRKKDKPNIKNIYYRPVDNHQLTDTREKIEDLDWKKVNPNIGDFIEVEYTFENKDYKVAYVYPSNIHFPPYEKGEETTNGVLFADAGDMDVSQECMQYAGPLGNFYSDLPSRYGIRIIGGLISNEDIKITTNFGEEHTFKKNDVLKT